MAPEPWPDLIIMWEIFQVFQQCFFPCPDWSSEFNICGCRGPCSTIPFWSAFQLKQNCKAKEERLLKRMDAPLIKLNQILGQDDEFYAFSRGNAMCNVHLINLLLAKLYSRYLIRIMWWHLGTFQHWSPLFKLNSPRKHRLQCSGPRKCWYLSVIKRMCAKNRIILQYFAIFLVRMHVKCQKKIALRIVQMGLELPSAGTTIWSG